MPGLDFYAYEAKEAPITTKVEILPASTEHLHSNVVVENDDSGSDSEPASVMDIRDPEVYYNARLDPKNYTEGPLSPIASTRLRQMLARPGIIVRQGELKLPNYTSDVVILIEGRSGNLRWY